MRRFLLCALLIAACGDNGGTPLRDDTGPPDAAPDGGSDRVTGCLDSPQMPGAPTSQLPCDLVPPGLAL